MFVDIKEQIAVIKCYIAHRTDKDIEINLNQFENPVNVLLLNQAYQIAIRWFQENNGKIELLKNA